VASEFVAIWQQVLARLRQDAVASIPNGNVHLSGHTEPIDVKNVFYVFYFSHVFYVFLTFFIFANVFYYKKRYEFQAVSSKRKQGHTLNFKKM
jgi:hypothetical protein